MRGWQNANSKIFKVQSYHEVLLGWTKKTWNWISCSPTFFFLSFSVLKATL
jgi:hypothetical protein